MFEAVVSLRRADLAAALAFLGEVAALDLDEAYPYEVLARLQDLIRCDAITYQEVDLRAKRFGRMVGWPDNEDDADDNDLYWALGPCPISSFRARTGDLSAVRISDLIGRRRYHELPIYREYFRPAGVDHVIGLGVPMAAHWHRDFLLFRRTESGDFSERDRTVLEMLRPHLCRLEAHAALQRRRAQTKGTQNDDDAAAVYASLTPREREIVEMVAEGKTNAQVAAQLWVAPSTVKKHLEHVYEKLGVNGRTAAAARARASV